jgi:hypothetical protein
MIKLPRTYHIEGSRLAAGESDPDAVQFKTLDGKFLVIEEKLDGAGVSIFFDENLTIQVWHRGSQAEGNEYRPLYQWADINLDYLFSILGQRYILFGEWMLKKHTIYYDTLPEYFLESDIYDKESQLWLSSYKRADLLKDNVIKSVPIIAMFKPSRLEQIISLIGPSKYRSIMWKENLKKACHRICSYDEVLSQTDCTNLMEGLYIKHEDDTQVFNRYKYIRYEFLQKILSSKSHILDRVLIRNGVIDGEVY